MKRLLTFMLFLFWASLTGYAQQGVGRMSVDELVSQIRKNVEALRASIPDFVCEENVTSTVRVNSQTALDTSIKSVMRATPKASRDGEFGYNETREIKTVNGRTPSKPDFALPFVFNGGFSNDLAGVFAGYDVDCFDFKLAGTTKINDINAFIITVTTKANPGPKCHGRPAGVTGTAWVDSETKQIVRLQGPKDGHTSEMKNVAVTGWREDMLLNWSVDYAKIVIDDKYFWMPSQVTARVDSTSRDRSMRYVATYKNYHKFGASSKITVDNNNQE